MERYKAIGLMSGTSLDGLDLAAIEFRLSNNKWHYEILTGETIPYSVDWKNRLEKLPFSDAYSFALAHSEYGHFLGREASDFLKRINFRPDIIASHGHTIFHQPARKLTVQIGDGSAIAAETGIPVICDFRSADVALGGQGAPLVPIGDRLLFSEFDACLNIGGFANVSMETEGARIAFDICPANIALNRLAKENGQEYDKDGTLAGSGFTDTMLLDKLNRLQYYELPPPKSLGREWLEKAFMPVAEDKTISLPDRARSVCEHIAFQINRAINDELPCKILVTGGGARNRFLMQRIRNMSHHDWYIPDNLLVDYKEALIFAFLGILRYTNRVNILRSVTGCRNDHTGGAFYQLLQPLTNI
ncbi:MAG TPA: anhydro-N-acetylmuramic acid kinase [Bacteroidales bacterium]|nr:anhydro-N-acetylmuramic acid kinase [Bacteroidales bacterium]